MKRAVAVFAVLLVAAVGRADEEVKHNVLTPKEAAEGWLLLFDGQTTFGWKSDGEAAVRDGTLVLTAAKAKATAEFNAQFRSFELQFEYQQPLNEADKKLTAALHLRPTFNAAALLHTTAKVAWHQVSVRVTPSEAKTTIRFTPDDSRTMTAHTNFGEQTVLDRNGVMFKIPEGGRLAVRDVKLRPLDLKPLFNGKDLTGWKEHPGKKTKFSVTKEGWLNLKDGPGDLQTTGQYDDFVLQAECFSNGKHLNSGIFFRCRPDEYQQGYEAQIHNGFTAEPTKEYTIEEYDPETHELKGSKKVKYAAMDYGTGAIYRRIPARVQAAKDEEWFTMTVAAHGRHMATWVNGVQVVDWTDNRPLKDNARNGCRLERGPISLQGHDPTTDLNFRNLRLAELGKAAEKE